jgi:arabinan endo-1,5-alpha-L-arabinosidase
LFGKISIGIASLPLFILCACMGAKKTETKLPYSGFRPLGDDTIAADSSLWGELNVHDPSVITDGDYYYVFSTDASNGNRHPLGVQIRRSKDLVTWEYRGAAFRDFKNDCAEVIAWAGLWLPNHDGLWAPDIIKSGGWYRLYFSASTFGSQKSCIALAESKNIEGPYTYKGIVVKSSAGRGPNAIDPALVRSKEGGLYMAYGSFFGGIWLAELDGKTGFFKDAAEPVKIAGGDHAAVEGPAIVYLPETDYYYLFVSYGSLSKDYNIRLARSRRIEGPYLDARGRDMNNAALVKTGRAGLKLMGGYNFDTDSRAADSGGYKAPGHNTVLVDGEDRFILHHVRSYALPDYWFTMNVRRFALNRFGWPVISPLRYAGERFDPVDLPGGDYKLIRHGDDTNATSPEALSVHLEAGVFTGSLSGTYRIYDGFHIELLLNGEPYDGFVFSRPKAEEGRRDYAETGFCAFSVMSEDGYCIWGLFRL